MAVQQALEVPSPEETAHEAGLRYVSDSTPGITRERRGPSFTYRGADGTVLRDATTSARIKSLAIPPAWIDVWICPRSNGHLQATGRDQRGRKQYRYHPRWREVRDESKFGRMVAFGEALPRIRRRVDKDLRLPGMPREKVLATVVRLLEMTSIRVGNEEYARANGSFGLTTLRNEHTKIDKATISFKFRGKSGKEHHVDVRDRRLASVVQRCRDLPGHDLFEYIDAAGEPQTIGSSDVNEYIHEAAREAFTAKDFRTWRGTVMAASALYSAGPADTAVAATQSVNAAVAEVAEALGNTVAVCRKFYVHPAVVSAYLDGRLADGWEGARPIRGLTPEESATLAVLRTVAEP